MIKSNSKTSENAELKKDNKHDKVTDRTAEKKLEIARAKDFIGTGPEVRLATGLEIFMFLSMHALSSQKRLFCQICSL